MFSAISFCPNSAKRYFSMPNLKGYRRSTLSCSDTWMFMSVIRKGPFLRINIIRATFRISGLCCSSRPEPDRLSIAFMELKSMSMFGYISKEPTSFAPTMPLRSVMAGAISVTVGKVR